VHKSGLKSSNSI